MPMRCHVATAIAFLAALPDGARAFYLPGVAVHEYQQDEAVGIKVNKLTSTKTQLVRAPRLLFLSPTHKRASATNAGARARRAKKSRRKFTRSPPRLRSRTISTRCPSASRKMS